MTLYLSETTLFYHHLRATGTRTPSVAHPTTRSDSGLVANWAEQVAHAATFGLPSTPVAGGTSLGVGFGLNPSGSRANSRLPKTPFYQPGGLDNIKNILNDDDDILANLVPLHKTTRVPNKLVSFVIRLLFSLMLSLRQVPLKRELDDLTLTPVLTANKKNRKSFPIAAEDENRFRGVFIPTYERWVGTQANPWVIPDDVAITTLQIIWDTIYPDVPWTVIAGDCVFSRVRVT
jgi:hypothetical protein